MKILFKLKTQRFQRFQTQQVRRQQIRRKAEVGGEKEKDRIFEQCQKLRKSLWIKGQKQKKRKKIWRRKKLEGRFGNDLYA